MSHRVTIVFHDPADAHEAAEWLDTIDDGAARDLAGAIRSQTPPVYDESDAYDRDDPKHPDWLDAVLD